MEANAKLAAAIQEADEITVNAALELGADPNLRDAQGLTPLAQAILPPDASLGVIRALRHAGARLDIPTGLEGELIDALLRHYPQWPDLFEVFLELDPTLPAVRSSLIRVLRRAAMLEDLRDLGILLDRFAPLSPAETETAFRVAREYGYTSSIDLLKYAGLAVVADGSSQMARDEIKVTSLMEAASELQVDVVEELLASGASLEPQDDLGRDVFDHLRLGLADLRFQEYQNEPKDPDAEDKYRRIRARLASPS